MNPDTPTNSAASARSAIVATTRRSFVTLREAASGGLAYRYALLFQGLLQFAGLEHLAHDVATSDKLTLHVKLRNRRPVGISLDAVPDVVRFQHVDTFVTDAEMVEDLDDLPRKSAHRKLRRALHEEHHVVALHFIVDELLDTHGISSCWAAQPPRSPIYVPKKLLQTQGAFADSFVFRGIKPAFHLENIVLVQAGNLKDRAGRIGPAAPQSFPHLVDQRTQPTHVGHEDREANAIDKP